MEDVAASRPCKNFDHGTPPCNSYIQEHAHARLVFCSKKCNNAWHEREVRPSRKMSSGSAEQRSTRLCSSVLQRM